MVNARLITTLSAKATSTPRAGNRVIWMAIAKANPTTTFVMASTIDMHRDCRLRQPGTDFATVLAQYKRSFRTASAAPPLPALRMRVLYPDRVDGFLRSAGIDLDEVLGALQRGGTAKPAWTAV